MSLVVKHQAERKSRTDKSKIYEETLIGPKSEVQTYYNSLVPKTLTSGKGYLDQYTMQQEGGDLWSVTASYSYEYSESGDQEDEGTGPQVASLSSSMLSLPLEANPNYRTKWNHYLLGKDEYAQTLPADYDDATDEIPISENYRWVKSLSEVPTEPDSEGALWGIAAQPTKPGVEVWQKPVWQVRETSRYTSKTKAQWVTTQTVGSIVAAPLSGNFGITTGNWLVEAGSVAFDGKKWLSDLTYTHSGDAEGWDEDLYGSGSSSS